MSAMIKKLSKNPIVQSIISGVLTTVFIRILERSILGREPNIIFYLIYFALSIFLFYICLRKKKTSISDKHYIYKYSNKQRKFAFSGLILTIILFLLILFNIHRIIYYEITIDKTPENKVGIWIAKFSEKGDQPHNQQGLIQKINFFILGDEKIRDLVEVKELPFEIEGKTREEQEKNALKYGKKYNAAIVIWGAIAPEIKTDHLYLFVTLTRGINYFFDRRRPSDIKNIVFNWKGPFVKHKTNPLQIVSEAIIKREHIDLKPYRINLSRLPQRIVEPMQIAKLVVGLSMLEIDQCEEGIEHLNDFIESNLNTSFFDVSDAYSFLGHAFLCMYYKSKNNKYLKDVIINYDLAAKHYKNANDNVKYSLTEFNNACAHLMLSEQGINPKNNSEIGVQKLTTALDNIGLPDKVGPIYSNLGLAYLYKAAYGNSSEEDLKLSAYNFEKAIEARKKEKEQIEYNDVAGIISVLGAVYRSLAGFESKKNNSEKAKELFESACLIFKEQKNWKSFIRSSIQLASVELEIAKFYINNENVLIRTENIIDEIFDINKQYKVSYDFYDSDKLGEIYISLAQLGGDPLKNFENAIQFFLELLKVKKEKKEDYDDVLLNLGTAYVELVQAGKTKYSRDALKYLTEVVDPKSDPNDPEEYSDVQNQIGRVYLYLVNEPDNRNANIKRAKKAFEEALNLNPENTSALTNYGLSCLASAELGLDPNANLVLAKNTLIKATKRRKEEGKVFGYAISLLGLGETCSKLVEKGINIEENIQDSKNYLNEALELFSNTKRSDIFVVSLLKIADAYANSAKYFKNRDDMARAKKYLEIGFSIANTMGNRNLSTAWLQLSGKILCIAQELNMLNEQEKNALKSLSEIGMNRECN